jgi:hypothetical protein
MVWHVFPVAAALEIPLRGRKGESVDFARTIRATRRKSELPSDAEIERGLRERAVSDPRAAEILLRWLQRPGADNPPGVDLDAMSEARLERLHAGLVELATMDETVLAALVERVLADDELARLVVLAREQDRVTSRREPRQRQFGVDRAARRYVAGSGPICTTGMS